ncbi:MAG TPA: hypothetical protein VMM76_22505 [Pirellulaceae bacterium]|nr:hypothetical protein [Pirellulaceae bacterium]
MANAIAQEEVVSERVGDDEAGRLPPGYTIVVTKEQRSRIYEIQSKYESQLADLRKQIATIESGRDQEIEGLLDAEQKTILSYVLKVRERDRMKQAPIESGGN